MNRTARNLVYVFADQLRFQSLGYAGDEKAITPHIDRFARQSVNFRNAVANSPVCAAYRASLLTGRYTTSHGMVINELRLHPNQRCFGHVLGDAGYRTSYIGKWHLYANELGNHHETRNSFVPRGPERLGFDGEWMAYNFWHTNYDTWYHTDTPDKIFFDEGVYAPEGQTDLAVDFLRRCASDAATPFALFLSWGPPHDPWGPDNVPRRFWKLFEDVQFSNPPNYRPDDDEPYADLWARLSGDDRRSLAEWRRGYYAQIASIDETFGRLLRALDETGLADDTIVVFTSDHGEMLGGQGRRAKNIFYEEACRVPLLMRSPGQIPAGTASDACISTVDLLPTLLSLLHLEPPQTAEGADLSALARGEAGPQPEAAFLQGCGATASWDEGHEWRAVRDNRFTYAVYRIDRRELLFHNAADPYQTRDLAREPDHAADLARLRTLLRTKMDELNDTFVTSAWYRDHWTDGDRRIIRSATSDFRSAV